jgi:hypothetical protein
MSKKRGNNRKKQVAPKTKPVAPTTGLTRRDMIGAGVTVAAGVVATEISKYLPGPAQTVVVAPVTNPQRTVSLGILWGKPTTPTPIIQDNDGIASNDGNFTKG